MRCEERSLDDIRALGGNSAEDDRRFAAAARVSEINLALYRTFAQPFVKAMVNPVTVEVLQRFHPLRLQYEMFSNANPLMAMLPGLAEQVRKDRRPVASNNPFLAIQENFSDEMIKLLDRMRQGIEQTSERLFLTLYGLPTLQTAVGIDPHSDQRLRHVAKDPLHSQLQQQRIAELRANMNQGGLPAATIRSLLFAALERGAIDERGFEALKRIREAHTDMALPEFKTMVREQSLMLLIDTDAALAAIPAMLPENVDQRTTAIGFIRQVLGAQGALSDADQQRLKRVEELFSRPANAQRGA
jgi:hypothetical protein